LPTCARCTARSLQKSTSGRYFYNGALAQESQLLPDKSAEAFVVS
jgi:hypothetical protein